MRESADAAPAVDESTLFETPLVELDLGVAPTMYAKVEWFNLLDAGPSGGSVKSRIARSMVDAAEVAGGLDDGATILEPSSGNTGAAVARIGRARGYDVEIVTTADAGVGKRRAIREAGAQIRTVPADATYDAIIDRVESLVSSGDYCWLNQYDNPNNPGIHESTTGAEIREQSPEVDAFVTGVGTGGTISGVARALDADGGRGGAGDDGVRVVGYEPAADSTDIEGLRYLRTGDHPYQSTYERARLDDRRYLTTDDAYKGARWLREQYADREVRVHDGGQWDTATVREELRVDGEFLVGPSSGGNVALIRELAGEGALGADDTVVTMLCDRGDRYREGLWSDVVG
ncbi:pyridoxal-phosphate dependent enzyme [Halorubrum gandharaense]